MRVDPTLMRAKKAEFFRARGLCEDCGGELESVEAGTEIARIGTKCYDCARRKRFWHMSRLQLSRTKGDQR